MDVTIKSKVDEEAIAGLLSDTFPQIVGTGYWAADIEADGLPIDDLLEGKSITFVVDDEGDGSEITRVTLTQQALLNALAKVAIERLLEDYDWMLGDYIIQEAIFGRQVYA